MTSSLINKYDNIQIDFTGLGNPKATIRTIFQDRLKSHFKVFFKDSYYVKKAYTDYRFEPH